MEKKYSEKIQYELLLNIYFEKENNITFYNNRKNL